MNYFYNGLLAYIHVEFLINLYNQLKMKDPINISKHFGYQFAVFLHIRSNSSANPVKIGFIPGVQILLFTRNFLFGKINQKIFKKKNSKIF